MKNQQSPLISVIRWSLLASLSCCVVQYAHGKTEQTLSTISILPQPAENLPPLLLGPDAGLQLSVTGQIEGQSVDYTRVTTYLAEPEGIVAIDPTGWVTPLANGMVRVRAEIHDGPYAETSIRVSEIERSQPVHFANDLVPIFTKFGCNSGGCHGKSGGQNGFRLSLLGFEPDEDYNHLVREGRGRRLFPAAPDYSLFLLKASGRMPHGGGSRIKEGSHAYRLIRRWIAQGMPPGDPNAAKLARIEIKPDYLLLPREAGQQLTVTAHMTDGSSYDATRIVRYSSNEPEMAEVSPTGLVTIGKVTGDAAIMVRYQEQAGVFRATIPLGVPVDSLPPTRNFIDELVYEKLRVLGLPPSKPCDDTTFLRRTALDIAGRLPTPAEAQSFFANKDTNRGNQWIAELLESTDYADYFANKWSAILRNRRENDLDKRGTFAFHAWLRESLHANVPYDQLLRELMTASGELANRPAVAWYRAVAKNEERMQDVAQVFLGVRLQCAQCHHHPFEQWSQEDYYGFSAFFSRVKTKSGTRPREAVFYHSPGVASVKSPKTGKPVPPTGLGSDAFNLSPEADPRYALADWMTAPSNPFFARMLVNRYWKHFFGRGLVEPEDDIRVTNPATHPELLKALSRYFISSGYDMKRLIQLICESQVYQLSSLPNEFNAEDRMNYSRFQPRRLPAEVLLDSICELTGVPSKFPGLPAGVKAVQLPDNQFTKDSYFLTVFGRPEMNSACECERTQDANLAQCLHLLNSKQLHEKLTADKGRAAKLALDTSRKEEEKIKEIYLLGYAREPNDKEMELALAQLEKKASGLTDEEEMKKARREAYEDLLWVMINSKEFLFQH